MTAIFSRVLLILLKLYNQCSFQEFSMRNVVNNLMKNMYWILSRHTSGYDIYCYFEYLQYSGTYPRERPGRLVLLR